MAHLQITSKIFILIILLTACGNSVKKESSPIPEAISEKNEDEQKITNSENSGIESLLALKSNKASMDSFFNLIEKDLVDDSIFGGVTKIQLDDFFNSIKKEELTKEAEFSKDYEFNRFPSEYSSKEKCEDGISLRIAEGLSLYYLTITNSFYVEDFGCSDHSAVYTFRIENDQIEIVEIIKAG